MKLTHGNIRIEEVLKNSKLIRVRCSSTISTVKEISPGVWIPLMSSALMDMKQGGIRLFLGIPKKNSSESVGEQNGARGNKGQW
jgi:hypothetical protein